MADLAALALGPVFAAFGAPATYQAASGATAAVRVLSRRADITTGFGATSVVSEGALFEVAAAALEAAGIRPWIGDRLLVGDDLFEVQAPPVRRDPDRRVWTLDAVQIPAPTTYPQFDPPTVPGPIETVLGPNAPPGVWTGTYLTLPLVPVAAGQVVHIEPGGRLALSRADAAATARADGTVIIAPAAPGDPARWATNRPVARAEWSAIIEGGAAALAPGREYWLSAAVAGGITPIPPSEPGRWLVPVGWAVGPTVLHFAPGAPVLLT